MTSRAERAAGENNAGEVTPKRLAEILGVAHGTAKRWIHEGLPRTRANAHETWVNLDDARAWLAKRFGGRLHDRFAAHAVGAEWFEATPELKEWIAGIGRLS